MSVRKRIRERGEVSVKIVSYTLASLFILLSIVPLIWMISSSMKDNITVYRFPPTWIPDSPKAITVALNYDGTKLQKPEEFELDAMKAIWFTWKKMQNEPIGEMEITGIKDNKIIYKASMPSYKFTSGRPQIVPTQLFNDSTMRLKIPMIRERSLTKFEWLQDTEVYTGPNTLRNDLPETSSGVYYQLNESNYIDGQVLSISEKEKWLRLFDNYMVLWQVAGGGVDSYGFPHFLWNSVLVTGASILAHLMIGGLAGYALAHLVHGRLKGIMTLFFVATIMIPDIAILVPLYLTMDQLHLVNTLWGVFLPKTAWGVVIFLFRGFFEQLPKELLQAARIDGASELHIYWRMIVPMSAPIFTVVSVMTFFAVWNEFLWPLVIARSPSVWTFTVALNDFQQRQSMGANVLMASLVIASIPTIIIIITCQKLIERGVSFTGLKG